MKENDKKIYAASVIGFAAVILAAGILMYEEWRSYEEKREILYVTLEQQGEGKAAIDIVSGLLKGQAGIDVTQAKQRMEQYGFHKDYADYYKKSLYDRWTATIVIVCLLYVIFIILIYQTDKHRYRQRKRELLWLQEQITALRDSAAESFQGNSSNSQFLLEDKWKTVNKYDDDLGRMAMAFSSLADSLSLFRQQARTEREGTKVLVMDISHQLKTPVAALKTSFEILQTGSLSEAEYQEFLERCSIQIRRLEELVAALVNISRMETGLIELKKEKKNLFETLLLAVNRIYPKAEEKEIEIELEADESLQQIQVIHDQKWLCEAFLNVLENAVKYSAKS